MSSEPKEKWWKITRHDVGTSWINPNWGIWAEARIKELEKQLEAKGGWVSVKDGLPERMQECHFINLNIKASKVTTGWYDNGFYSYTDCHPRTKLNATYWHPLPPPPEAE